MFAQLSDWIAHKATKKNVIVTSVLSVVYLVPYAAFAFRGQQAKGLLIDQRLFTPPATFHTILASYGPALRAQYVHAEYIDLAVAGVAFTIALVVSFAGKRRGWNTRLNLIPVLAGVLNTIKALIFVPLINAFPHESSAGVWVANVFNLPKDLAMLASVLLLVAAIGSLMRPARPRIVGKQV